MGGEKSVGLDLFCFLLFFSSLLCLFLESINVRLSSSKGIYQRIKEWHIGFFLDITSGGRVIHWILRCLWLQVCGGGGSRDLV
ncbi:hypothetical protein QBC44DRAFT_329088 [Cladorrhinum sp. PSN332]|nr:hypothetical protein QBC44DRAFT_329088 [Cladorrhinum sp. PSN332]